MMPTVYIPVRHLLKRILIHYFYTGNVKYFDRDDYDYIMKGRGSNVLHVTSRDADDMY